MTAASDYARVAAAARLLIESERPAPLPPGCCLVRGSALVGLMAEADLSPDDALFVVIDRAALAGLQRAGRRAVWEEARTDGDEPDDEEREEAEEEPAVEVEDWPAAIRALRKRRGWTQAGLAARVGVSGATVSHWEARRWPPGAASRVVLAELIAEGGRG